MTPCRPSGTATVATYVCFHTQYQAVSAAGITITPIAAVHKWRLQEDAPTTVNGCKINSRAINGNGHQSVITSHCQALFITTRQDWMRAERGPQAGSSSHRLVYNVLEQYTPTLQLCSCTPS